MTSRFNPESPLSKQRITAILDLIADKPLGAMDISKRLTIPANRVYVLCVYLNKEDEHGKKRIHIEDYGVHECVIRSKCSALYRAGHGVDMPKPKGMTPKEWKDRKRRERKLAELEQKPVEVTIQRDWLQVAFHGPAKSSNGQAVRP